MVFPITTVGADLIRTREARADLIRDREAEADLIRTREDQIQGKGVGADQFECL